MTEHVEGQPYGGAGDSSRRCYHLARAVQPGRPGGASPPHRQRRLRRFRDGAFERPRLRQERIEQSRCLMGSRQIDVVLRQFGSPDETRVMAKGKFEVVPSGASPLAEQATSRGGGGPSMLARRSAPSVVPSCTSGLLSRARRRRRWRTGACSSFGRASCSTSLESRTTAGWWGTAPFVSLHFLGADHYAT
jgi:hypothetical protein